MSLNVINNNMPPVFKQMNTISEAKTSKKNIKSIALTGSAIGTGVALALISKKQGFSLKPSVIFKTPIKDWAIFKIAQKNNPNRKLLSIKGKEIIKLASGSILGGFVSGALYDRKNINAKCREVLTQMVGNVLVPLGFVAGISTLYKNHEEKIKSFMPQFKSSKNIVKYINKFIKNIPAVGFTALGLGLGIYTGSKVTNFINEKFFGQKVNRNIKSSDFAPHVDDLCLAVTLMGSENSPLATGISRAVPFFLAIPGYQVGKAQDKNV